MHARHRVVGADVIVPGALQLFSHAVGRDGSLACILAIAAGDAQHDADDSERCGKQCVTYAYPRSISGRVCAIDVDWLDADDEWSCP